MALARGMAMRLGGQLVGGLASLAVLPLLIRHLGVEDFGRYVAVLALVAIAALASDVGLTGLALRDSALAPGESRRQVLAGLFGLRFAVAALGACGAIGFALAAGYEGSAVAGTALASAGLFPQIYADMVVVALVVEGRFGGAAAIETARSVGASLLIVILVIADADLVWFLAAWGGAAVIGALVARVVGAGAADWPRPSAAEARRVLAGASGYGLATALHVVYFRAVMLVVAGRAVAVEAGWFAAGFRITEFVGAAAGQVAGSATPTLARAAPAAPGGSAAPASAAPASAAPASAAPASAAPAPAGVSHGSAVASHASAIASSTSAAVSPASAAFSRQAERVIGAACGVGILVAAVLAVGAPLIMRILGGDALEPGAGVLRIQAIAAGLMFPAFAAGAALFVLRRHRDMVIANASALVVALVFAFILVPSHGARGGAVAAVLGEALLVLLEVALLLRAA